MSPGLMMLIAVFAFVGGTVGLIRMMRQRER